MKSRGFQRDEERHYVTTRLGEGGGFTVPSSWAPSVLLCTDHSLRPARRDIPSPPPPLDARAEHAVPKGRDSRDNHRPTRRFSCGCHAKPSRLQQASMWPTVHRRLLANSFFQVFRGSGVVYGKITLPCWIHRGCHGQTTHPAADGCVTGRTKDPRTYPRDRT
ncbi:hypothetical protein GWK47_048619 [Chionoecetes opilio]|uniref:Uncharacterized protein n=1 Tax=Chionoecetes opilio TaxID=41210 RepID=A0A8J4Y2T4_CHIOP|nr:hypothetical protein GWK47_048619 [Chionoecetes opilio]